MSSVFCICPKTQFSIFTSQKISSISRKSLCRPLSRRGCKKIDIYQKIKSDINQNILFFKPHNFEKFQQNLIISKSAKIYHLSSNMAYGIGQAHKLGKQNRKRLDKTTDTYSLRSTPSYSYDKLNENTDINSKNIVNFRDIFYNHFFYRR